MDRTIILYKETAEYWAEKGETYMETNAVRPFPELFKGIEKADIASAVRY